MTRETRIGLLVGLAFIVMFGLVLSELTGPNDAAQTPPRQLTEAVTEGWSPIIELPVEPEIAAAAPQPHYAAAGAGQIVPADEAPAVVVSSLVAPRDASPSETVHALLHQPAPAAPAPAGLPAPVAAASPGGEAPRVYTVAPGDSLAKIARAVYGPQHEGEYRRIYEANRNVLSDESVVQVGQELVIPPLNDAPQVAACRPARPAAPSDRRGYREMDLQQLQSHFLAARNEPARQVRQERKPSGRVYVVQANDNLSKIARRFLNSNSREAVMKIYNANRDKLTSPNIVPVGVTLKIPT